MSPISDDGVLVVEQLPDPVVVGADGSFHGDFAGGVSLDGDAAVDDQNAAGKLGRQTGFQKMKFKVGKFRLVHENRLVTCAWVW